MTPIERARKYIQTRVQEPALRHPELSEKIKSKVRSSNIWLAQFTRVGDLIVYIKRFQLGSEAPIYQQMSELGLKTFEDVALEFENEFMLWANDCTRPSDFIVGKEYSAHEILIFARNYDTRAGGMFVLDSGGKPECVVIKATLSGGRYANEWLEQPSRLKYFLKSLTNSKTGEVTFGEHFKPNAAILNYAKIPILAFVRATDDDEFVYQGIFNYHSITPEQDGSKWFELRRDTWKQDVIEGAEFQAKLFAKEVAKSYLTPRSERLARLAIAPKKPQEIQILSTGYNRNPDVVAEVLERAKGHCEACGHPAPFLRKKDGTPYLEVHHKLQLALGGEDTVENAEALCPNCHRKSHFG